MHFSNHVDTANGPPLPPPNNVGRGLSNTPKLSPMDKGHKQPDSPEVSSRET